MFQKGKFMGKYGTENRHLKFKSEYIKKALKVINSQEKCIQDY